MSADETGPGSAGAVLPGAGDPSGELDRLRASERRQATVIDTLRAAVTNLSAGAKALKAENSELRAEIARFRGLQRRAADMDGAGLTEVAIPFGSAAPGVARTAIERSLAGHVASSVLENARLLASELVTNSVRHSGAGDGAVVLLRVNLWRDACRLEVEDPGSDGVIAPQPQDMHNGSGMGLNLVQMLSERWGVVRAGDGPTRVWAQLSCLPTAADAALAANGGPPPAARGV